MNRRARAVLLVAGFALLAGPIAAALLADARTARIHQLVTAIEAAQESLTFHGVRAVTHREGGQDVTAVFRVAGAPPDRRKVEFVAMEGGARPSKPAAFHPLMFLSMVQRALSGPAPGRNPQRRFGNPALIAENYDLRGLGREEIAGRAADGFALVPRHAGRASYRFWADAQNRFLLRFEVWQGKERVHQSSHRAITFGTTGGASFDAKKPPRRLLPVDCEPVDEKELPVAVPFRVYLPAAVPAGFVRTRLDHVGVSVPGFKEPVHVIHASYSDGMAQIMVLEFDANSRFWKQLRAWLAGVGPAPSPPPEAKDKIVVEKAGGRGSCAMQLTAKGTEIIVSGQVDPEALKEMIGSMNPADGR